MQDLNVLKLVLEKCRDINPKIYFKKDGEEFGVYWVIEQKDSEEKIENGLKEGVVSSYSSEDCNEDCEEIGTITLEPKRLEENKLDAYDHLYYVRSPITSGSIPTIIKKGFPY